MNGTHLPAGQPMPGVVSGAASGHGMNQGRRRAPPPLSYAVHPAHQHQHQHQPHHQAQHHSYQQSPAVMYPYSHMNAYANSYYPPQQMSHHYQTTAQMHSPAAYMPSYNSYHHQQQQQQQRSPPQPIHQTYPPIVSSSMQSHPSPYARPHPQQPSPALSTPPPPPPAAAAPHTPTSVHSSQAAAAPLSPVAPQPQTTASLPPAHTEAPAPRPFKYPLPWFSHPDESFPFRASKLRRRRRRLSVTKSVELPQNNYNAEGLGEKAQTPSPDDPTAPDTPRGKPGGNAPSADSTLNTSAIDSPQAEHVHSASASSTPAYTPSTTSSSAETNRSTAARAAVPAIPIVPILPKMSPKETRTPTATTETSSTSVSSHGAPQQSAEDGQASSIAEPVAAQPVKSGPKLWSNLFQNKGHSVTRPEGAVNTGFGATASGMPASDPTAAGNGLAGPGSFAKSNTSSLAEALRDYQFTSGHKIAFIEPRGLVNTGNMCYMNSVLQALIFCTPFYDFLDHLSQAASHSFKSETPLIDAMIIFLREYKVMHSAASEDQLRKRLRNEELEQYGDAFIPEIVYDAMKRLPTFASMQRGHQQDAEEFLGFLLQALDNECTHVMRQLAESSAGINSSITSNGTSALDQTADSNDWLEVGRKQRAAVTRSSGVTASSPISKVFSGQLRSTLRVPGLTDSVTFESYQPLQLDIGDAHVTNIVDALKHLTRSEKLIGDFGSPRPDAKPTTKQVLIESVPPVLILHLKRFSYNASENSTGKLWKNIDYPLELELPKEMFSSTKRVALQNEGVGGLKYRLTAAVYHHGKSASGGHYTVDLRRQDGREWIRVDDTVIRRIRSEDVAESSADGSASKSTWVDQKHSVIGPATGNRFEGINQEDGGDEDGWNKVGSASTGAKKWSSVANTNGSGQTAPAKNKSLKDSVKDNKVAYLLFYQKI
ncbi:cysteine proteinase [Astrocystis sublimbata]|nr:cysteine proteinase [Astrocystis sublimbata]